MEARLNDLKSQLGDLASTYPKPEHEGQFITQQSSFQVKEDTEDQRQTPWKENLTSSIHPVFITYFFRDLGKRF